MKFKILIILTIRVAVSALAAAETFVIGALFLISIINLYLIVYIKLPILNDLQYFFRVIFFQ